MAGPPAILLFPAVSVAQVLLVQNYRFAAGDVRLVHLGYGKYKGSAERRTLYRDVYEFQHRGMDDFGRNQQWHGVGESSLSSELRILTFPI